MSFCGFVGRKKGKLALILNAVDPHVGGVLFVGEKGTGKSTLARSFAALLPDGAPFVEVPQNVTEDALVGGVDIEASIRTGTRRLEPGLTSRARGGVLHMDDVNLLSSHLLSLILNSRDRDEAESPGFILLGGMNPDEGSLSPHILDAFGLCCFFERPADRLSRLQVLKRSARNAENVHRYAGVEKRLRGRIAAARCRVPEVVVPGEIFKFVVSASLEVNAVGHRGDLVLLRAARAYAAFRGDSTVLAKHVEKVLDLALVHRALALERLHPSKAQPEEAGESGRSGGETTGPDDVKEGEKEGGSPFGESSENSGEPGEWNDLEPLSRTGTPREETFAPGDVFRVRRISFDADRVERRASGRRTRTRHSGSGGRYIRSLQQPKKKDIAVDATLRAAAPWQKARGRSSILLLQEEDLRFKQRERKMGHLAVFVVDCSGSMGAKRRMIETKGAILSLLIDCYEKRDKVSMIAFRKDRAEIVLPPTNSVELASKRLEQMPVGGKTPLGAGLLKTFELLRKTRLKEPHTRIVVVIVSDGRANHSISDMSVREEIRRCAGILKEERNADFLVIDTEEKTGFMRADLAVELSRLLGAGYFTTENLRAEHLAMMVGAMKRRQFT